MSISHAIEFLVIAFLVALFEGMCHRSREDRRLSLKWYHVTAWILFNIYATSAIMITIGYWIGVVSELQTEAEEEYKPAFIINIHVHVVNAVLAVIERVVGNLPVRLLHFYWPMIFGTVYGLFTLLLYAIDDLILYDVLDWHRHSKEAGFFLLVMLFFGTMIIHILVVWGLFSVRVWFSSRNRLNRTISIASVEHSNTLV